MGETQSITGTTGEPEGKEQACPKKQQADTCSKPNDSHKHINAQRTQERGASSDSTLSSSGREKPWKEL